jgi:hypothetical protein
MFARAVDCRLSFYCHDPAAEARYIEALNAETSPASDPGAHTRALEAVNSTSYLGQNDAFGPSDHIALGVAARVGPVKPYLEAAAFAITLLPLVDGYGAFALANGGRAVLGMSRGFAANPAGTGATLRGADITQDMVRAAMKNARLSPSQPNISLPRVQAYYDKLAAGSVPPPIRVAGDLIVDGHHRYVAGQLFGELPGILPGGVPGSAFRGTWANTGISPWWW